MSEEEKLIRNYYGRIKHGKYGQRYSRKDKKLSMNNQILAALPQWNPSKGLESIFILLPSNPLLLFPSRRVAFSTGQVSDSITCRICLGDGISSLFAALLAGVPRALAVRSLSVGFGGIWVVISENGPLHIPMASQRTSGSSSSCKQIQNA